MRGEMLVEFFSRKGIALERLKAAALQMCSTQDKARNLEIAEKLIEEAAAAGAAFACLPERFNFYGPREENERQAETIPGETSHVLQELARGNGINIIGGSVLERIEGSAKFFNTSMVIDRRGELIGTYRKIHLFDISCPDLVSYKESAEIQPGDDLCFLTVDEVKVGVAICYDLRFPELFRHLALKGAEVIFTPSAFSSRTGSLHWEVLIRARAIENQAYLIAADQCGAHPGQPESFGESLIAAPQGRVLARLGKDEGVAAAELDVAMLRKLREEHPVLENVKRNFLGLVGKDEFVHGAC